jgi:hypothetical protein
VHREELQTEQQQQAEKRRRNCTPNSSGVPHSVSHHETAIFNDESNASNNGIALLCHWTIMVMGK